MNPGLQLITGGQRSGKSRHAEDLAMRWLQACPGRQVVVLATAQALDDEMHLRIERHRRDRPAAFEVVEESMSPGAVLHRLALAHGANGLVIVDCLTLWLTAVLMPCTAAAATRDWPVLRDEFLTALAACRASGLNVLVIGNELGSGVVPLGPQVRTFVDEAGWLNQAVARRCDRLTLMVAGQAWTRPVEDGTS